MIYGQAVTFYGRWLVEQGREATLDELSRSGVREWLAQLAERHELSTVRTRYKGLHRFCPWLVAEGELAENPLAGLDPPTAQPSRFPSFPTTTSPGSSRRVPARSSATAAMRL